MILGIGYLCICADVFELPVPKGPFDSNSSIPAYDAFFQLTEDIWIDLGNVLAEDNRYVQDCSLSVSRQLDRSVKRLVLQADTFPPCGIDRCGDLFIGSLPRVSMTIEQSIILSVWKQNHVCSGTHLMITQMFMVSPVESVQWAVTNRPNGPTKEESNAKFMPPQASSVIIPFSVV